MPKAFPKSETLSYKVVTSEPNLIEYEQTQLYTVALTGFKKEMKSLVHIELDDQDKVKKFEDRWCVSETFFPECPRHLSFVAFGLTLSLCSVSSTPGLAMHLQGR
jgi:hypothetical protein